MSIFITTELESSNQLERLAMLNVERIIMNSTCIAAVIMIIVSGSQMIFTWTRLVFSDSPSKDSGSETCNRRYRPDLMFFQG